MATFENPHPDVELGVPREPIDYALVLPSRGMSPNTGLIFYIHGFGFRYNDAYAGKLLPHLADTYDCIAVSVDYHGARYYHGKTKSRPAPDFFAKLEEHYGVTVTAPAGTDIWTIVNAVCVQLAKRGVTKLHPECQFVSGAEGYANFGILPAMDHLQILGAVLRDYAVDRKRLYVLSTSYGGYIALLLNKFAPNTFRLIVDNSGFSGPADTMPSLYGMASSVGVIRFVHRCLVAFSDDPSSPNYLSSSRKMIRDLAVAAHYNVPSETVVHSYHSEADTVAPTAAKKNLALVLGRRRRYDLRLISEADIDGHIFKNAKHGMDASLRGLFELSYRRWSAEAGDPPSITDFDLGTVIRFLCGEEAYVLTFGRDDVSLAVEPA